MGDELGWIRRIQCVMNWGGYGGEDPVGDELGQIRRIQCVMNWG